MSDFNMIKGLRIIEEAFATEHKPTKNVRRGRRTIKENEGAGAPASALNAAFNAAVQKFIVDMSQYSEEDNEAAADFVIEEWEEGLPAEMDAYYEAQAAYIHALANGATAGSSALETRAANVWEALLDQDGVIDENSSVEDIATAIAEYGEDLEIDANGALELDFVSDEALKSVGNSVSESRKAGRSRRAIKESDGISSKLEQVADWYAHALISDVESWMEHSYDDADYEEGLGIAIDMMDPASVHWPATLREFATRVMSDPTKAERVKERAYEIAAAELKRMSDARSLDESVRRRKATSSRRTR